MDLMALRELEDLLDIPELHLSGYEKQPDRVTISAELRRQSAVCSECGTRSTRRHGGKRIEVRDLPCFGRQIYVNLPRRRFKCRSCGKPFTERLAFVEFGTKFTRRYGEYVFAQCYERSLAAVASQEGISDTVVRDLYDRHSSAQVKPRGKPKTLRVLGLDEISMKKGHRHFVCVITDLDRKRVLEVLGDRLKETVLAYFTGLPPSVRQSIRYVSIDMWEGYYQAVKEGLPKRVKVVIDRFHVMKQLNAALTQCRRELQRAATTQEAKDELKGLRWILVTNESNLDAEQKARLRQLYRTCPNLKTCHRLKEEFRKIFDEETHRTHADQRLKNWKARARKTDLVSMQKFVDTLENWEEWILNYFTSGKITNGVVEGLNNKIKLIKRRGYGYRNNGNFRQRVLTECAG
jgi:transposase